MSNRKVYNKPASFSWRTLGTDGSSVTFGDAFTDGQTHSSAGIGSFPMEPFERLKDAFGILLVEADPVVLDGNAAELALWIRTITKNTYRGRYVGTLELDRVYDEVIQ